jgi:spore maturation protein CgeB
MLHKPRIAYFAQSLRSDWNNGNAHFLRGLMRSLGELGHEVTVYEPGENWSIVNLRTEPEGQRSLQDFSTTYPDLSVQSYDPGTMHDPASWRAALSGIDFVIVHEWNAPELAHCMLKLREELGFRLLFHDTHHRASSSPEQIRDFGIDRFDGVLAFGEVLRTIYQQRFDIQRVWTLHEAADTSIFRPQPGVKKSNDVVWIGNWGDDERSAEIKQFFLDPAVALPDCRFSIYGVRYPNEGLAALRRAGVMYRGYLPNISAPATYAASRLTVHIPRQQYATVMKGIPTIRVFEALACGVPLISAPWTDSEALFRKGDFIHVRNSDEARRAIQFLLSEPEAAAAQAMQGLETILAHHTCRHRAEQLSTLFQEQFS